MDADFTCSDRKVANSTKGDEDKEAVAEGETPESDSDKPDFTRHLAANK
jgi:hypothetical protein